MVTSGKHHEPSQASSKIIVRLTISKNPGSIHERFLDALALVIRYRIPLVLLLEISLAFLIRRPKPARSNTGDLERRSFALVPVDVAVFSKSVTYANDCKLWCSVSSDEPLGIKKWILRRDFCRFHQISSYSSSLYTIARITPANEITHSLSPPHLLLLAGLSRSQKVKSGLNGQPRPVIVSWTSLPDPNNHFYPYGSPSSYR